MLTADLDAAGIPYTVNTPLGVEHRDFHALRSCDISAVIRSGADLKQAMQLARHSDPRLTAGRYARARAEELSAVVNRTLNLTPPPVAPSVAADDDARGSSGTDEEIAVEVGSGDAGDENQENPCESKGLRAGGDDQGQLKAEREGFDVRFDASRIPNGGWDTKLNNQNDLWLIRVAHGVSGILRNGQRDWHTVPIIDQ